MTLQIPSGREQLDILMGLVRLSESRSSEFRGQATDRLDIIGTSLSALYQAATCHRKCFGGDHVIEALCGRAYNLGSAAYLLVNAGLYDEALGVIRIVGELSNLVALAVFKPTLAQEWIEGDKKTRREKFEPRHVREILKQIEGPLLYATSDWYGDLSESYIHITPQSRPNAHGLGPVVGPLFQEEGATRVIKEMTLVIGNLGLLVCKYFDLPDLTAELRSILMRMASEEAAPQT
jgi:hypothetical protein